MTSWTRFRPLLPAFALVTVYTSVTYNYAVQARLRLEAQRLHVLRLNALAELRNAVFVSSLGRRGSRQEDDEEVEEGVRGLIRLGLDPAQAGFGQLHRDILPTATSSSSAETVADGPRTGWSDVFFGGPNSYRAQHNGGARDGTGSTGETMTEILRRAMKSAFADFQVLGSGSGSGSGACKRALAEEEDEALERWIEQAMDNEDQDLPQTKLQPPSSPSIPDPPTPFQRVQSDLAPPAPAETQPQQQRRRARTAGRDEQTSSSDGRNLDGQQQRRPVPQRPILI
ncbi:unnamed protein product [Tilletia controversa]|nr:unnamed protein product [Tilletia controversa]